MTHDIASQHHGRAVPTYDLCDELADRYNITRAEAHDAIHAFLSQLADIDADAIVGTRPMRAELLNSNPGDVDVQSWITITDGAADDVRDAFAASHATDED